VAERFDAYGPVQTVSTGCTSGLDAVGYAFHTIEEGRADVCIAGASDSPISPITMACFDAIKATSPNNDDPEHASRPFDADRDGFVMGEGAAVMVLEELEHARRRGATIYAELAGYGLSSDAYHMTEPDPAGQARAMHLALAEAGLEASDVDYINAHASSTGLGDQTETAAIKLALGEETAHSTPISSIKGATGHCLGAAGAIEAAVTVLALRDQVLPPTINYEIADPMCDLDCIPNHARHHEFDVALSSSFGFGGHNAVLVFTRPSTSSDGARRSRAWT
jgi:minimal PKS ketosynthase (KS/KS alpha)